MKVLHILCLNLSDVVVFKFSNDIKKVVLKLSFQNVILYT